MTATPLHPASTASRLAYRALITTAPLARSRVGAAVWDRAWSQLERRGSGTAAIPLHGHTVLVNIGHPYPAFMRRWPTYNSPLVHAVRAAQNARGRAVTLVDVGASVGDTALLIRERCPGLVDEILCIEGDETFAALLEANVAALPGVHAECALAGDGSSTVPSLVRTHAGSASPRGDERMAASTLDQLTSSLQHVDVVKIDTDGYDGHVLLGARRVLRDHQPVVQFEWHPRLTAEAGADVRLPFETLADAGYESFVWFDKFGRNAWVESGFEGERLLALAEWCVTGATPSPDWHYDVVALAAGDRALVRPLTEPDQLGTPA